MSLCGVEESALDFIGAAFGVGRYLGFDLVILAQAKRKRTASSRQCALRFYSTEETDREAL
jgi:hypothetical protein